MDRWTETRRLEEWAGETRVNLVRAVALVALYGQHLASWFFFRGPWLTRGYHTTITALVIAWAFLVLALHLSLGRRYVPWWLKYLATAWDAAMITVLVVVSGGVDRSLVALYFLVIAAAPLRLSLPLVWGATAAAVTGYAVLLGHAMWYAPSQRLPRQQQVIFVIALLVAGLLAGQLVRQARRAALATGGPP
ncbi:MAG: hypothetical protein ACHQ1G_04300 [Planctomycetota bacterium]